MIFLGLSCFLLFKSSSSVCGCEEQSNIICLSDNLHPRTSSDGWSRPLALAVPRPMSFLIGNNA